MSAKYLVPNDDGVLVPSDVPSVGPLSDGERTLSLAANSGGSGEGMSHYAVAAQCGRKARLSQRRYEGFAERGAALPLVKNHFIVGSVYHLLHELLRKPRPGTTVDFNEQYNNPNVAEGVRLYKGWLRTWGEGFWGKTVAVEAKIVDEKTFAPARVSAQLDLVVEMDEAACERAKKRGLDLTPGRRVLDWKTADGPSDGVNYKEGLQALWYPAAWNIAHPDLPVDGIIFDCVYKRSRRKDRSVLLDDFGAHYKPYGMEDVEALRGMIEQATRNIENDTPNRALCCDWRGDVCPFRLNGECQTT